MGQQQSAFVVEIASSRYGNFQSIPQKDPDEEDEGNSSKWRITVNPSANFLSSSEELKNLINRLYRNQKLLSPAEARYLGTGLQFLDTTSDLLLPLLTVISNAAAYPSNHKIFFDCGITEKLAGMLKNTHAALPNPCKVKGHCQEENSDFHETAELVFFRRILSLFDWTNSVRVMLLQCLSNMAVFPESNGILKSSIPLLVKRLDSHIELESTVAFQALTNLSSSIKPSEIDHLRPSIQICFKKLWIRGELNLNSLRLLVNLSCCPDMVPHILAAKSVTGLLSILDTDKLEVLLRAVTWLLCMSSAVDALSITYDIIAPLNQDPFANPNYTIYFALYANKGKKEMEKRLLELTAGNDEVAAKADQLLKILSRIPEARVLGSSLNRL